MLRDKAIGVVYDFANLLCNMLAANIRKRPAISAGWQAVRGSCNYLPAFNCEKGPDFTGTGLITFHLGPRLCKQSRIHLRVSRNHSAFKLHECIKAATNTQVLQDYRAGVRDYKKSKKREWWSRRGTLDVIRVNSSGRYEDSRTIFTVIQKLY